MQTSFILSNFIQIVVITLLCPKSKSSAIPPLRANPIMTPRSRITCSNKIYSIRGCSSKREMSLKVLITKVIITIITIYIKGVASMGISLRAKAMEAIILKRSIQVYAQVQELHLGNQSWIQQMGNFLDSRHPLHHSKIVLIVCKTVVDLRENRLTMVNNKQLIYLS